MNEYKAGTVDYTSVVIPPRPPALTNENTELGLEASRLDHDGRPDRGPRRQLDAGERPRT